MWYYIAEFSDDHLIFADETRIDSLIKEYAQTHPRARFTGKGRITRKQYKVYLRNRDNPIYWLLLQGNPLKPLSDGKKELIARLAKK